MLDWVINLLLPPIITKFFDIIKNGNSSIVGTWADIGYETGTRKELYYAVFYIAQHNSELTMDGRIFDTSFTYLWSFKSDFCIQRDYTLKYVNIFGGRDSNIMNVIRGEFDFTKNGLRFPISFNGYYVSNNGRRIVEGIKLTKERLKKIKDAYPGNSSDPKNILRVLIPDLKA